MKTAFYSSDFQALRNNVITLDEAMTDVADIAYELLRFPTGLAGFAYSDEKIDQWHAEAFRNSMMILAHQCLASGFSDNEIAQVHAALAFVCSVDEYAAKEVAGRFMSLVRRLKVLSAIARHPRANRFYTLTDAIGRGKHTKAQWTLALKLASEVGFQLAA
jgi:hypothetical protein